MMTQPLRPTQLIRQDRERYRVFLCREGFQSLQPLEVPWDGVLSKPAAYPDFYLAKKSSIRSVIGLDVDTPEGPRRVFLKRSFIRSWLRKTLTVLIKTKEWNELQSMQLFRERGILVPEPVLYAEAEPPYAHRRTTFLATLSLPPQYRSLRELFDARGIVEGIWIPLARFTQDLHSRGLHHDDYRTDHVFYAEGEENPWALLDLDGANASVNRRSRYRALRLMIKSARESSLTFEQAEAFIKSYDPEGKWRFNPKELWEIAAPRKV